MVEVAAMMISRLKPFKTAAPAGADAVELTAMDRPVVRRFLSRERILAGALAVTMLSGALYGYVRFGLANAVSVEAARLSVATVRRGVFHDYIPVTGAVVPRTTVYLDTVAGGQVAQVLVEEGAAVAADQPLLVLKNAALELDVMGREAALAQQLYQLTTINMSMDDRRLQRARDLTDLDFQIHQVSAQLARKQPLLSSGYVSRAEIDDLERNLAHYKRMHTNVGDAQAADDASRPQQVEQLQHSIKLISDNLAITRKNLDALTVRAPIDGQLTLLDAEIGQVKTQGQRIGQIDSSDGLKVRANIDEFYVARVAVGQRATAEADGQTYALEVTKVYPGVRDRQFAVDLKFIAEPSRLRRGQTLHLKLEIGEAGESLMVANGAFYDDTGGQWAFVLSPSGDVATRRTVSFGRRNPDAVEVLSGLHAGERILVSTTAPYLKFDRIDIRGKFSEGETQP